MINSQFCEVGSLHSSRACCISVSFLRGCAKTDFVVMKKQCFCLFKFSLQKEYSASGKCFSSCSTI